MTQQETNIMMLQKVVEILLYDHMNEINVWFSQMDNESPDYVESWDTDKQRERFEKAKRWVAEPLQRRLSRMKKCSGD